MADNGIGYPSIRDAAKQQGLGLIGIRERAWLLGGAAHMESKPSGGVSVKVTVPLSAPTRISHTAYATTSMDTSSGR